MDLHLLVIAAYTALVILVFAGCFLLVQYFHQQADSDA
ncbi:hypothetical protein LCGC14_2781000 [marine sediment metagenome]|uniref:Uncharacterized protein n=1 Tax=marine sediment metagenome TaxID=412755 RepID=A0A0F9B1Z7_9ZZZZ